jgi:ornithine decarboxylase
MINKYVLNPVLKKLKADSMYNKMLDNININTNFIKNGESILSISLDNVRKKIDVWNKNMVDIKPHFAVKSFPDPKICSEFTYFDCASAGEIKMIQEINKNTNNIIYANTCKRPIDIKYALDNKVNLFTLDSVEELEKLQNIDENFKFLIRLSVDDSTSKVRFSNKFGVSELDEYKKIIQKINPKNQLAGFSFHVGSGQDDEFAYLKAVDKVDFYINYLKFNNRKLYDNLNTIDIGGGFNKKTNLELVYKSLEDKKKKYNSFSWIAEPGRFFSETSATLFCPIILTKNKNNKKIIVIPNSVYHSFSSKFYDGFKISCLKKNLHNNINNNQSEIEFEDGIIVGDSCDGIDVIYEGLIPKNLKINDIFILEDMGAYTYSSSSNFNGFTPPKHIYF